MEKLRIINTRERKVIQDLLEKQFNVAWTDVYALFMNSKNRIFIMSRDIARIDFDQLRINSLGMYFGEINKGELRLSIEGAQMLGPKADKNVLELDIEQSRKWMAGEDLFVDSSLHGWVIIRHKKDYLGCGRLLIDGKLLNYVPKERRVG